MDLAIVPWGYRKGGGWDHYRVARLVNGTAHESLCRHRSRSEAERCIAQRGGVDECIDTARPVSPELKALLSELFSLSSDAVRQQRDESAVRATAERIHDVAAQIIAATSEIRRIG